MENDLEAGALLAEANRAAAILTGDIDRLGAMLDDDLTYVHASGRREGKPELLEGLRSGTRYTNLKHIGLAAKAIGTAVVVTGQADIALIRAGTSEVVSMDTNFTQVWTIRSGSWTLIAHHASMR